MEKLIFVIGGVVGLGAGIAFYQVEQHLSLPALLYKIVDLFGVLAGAIVVGLLVTPIAIGAMVMLVDRIFPSQQSSEDP